MDAAAALVLAPEPDGCPAVEGLEDGLEAELPVPTPAAEAMDTAVDGREPEPDGNANANEELATIGGGAPGNASPNDSRESRCDGRSMKIGSEG